MLHLKTIARLGCCLGLALVFFLGVMPVSHVTAADGELTIMVWSHFIPDVDKQIKKHAEEFGKLKGIKVRVDTMDHHQFAAKKAAEAQAKSGHDIIQNYGADVLVYKNLMTPVDDVVKELGDQFGGYTDLAAETCQVEGVWKSVPWYYYPYPLVIRTDLIKKVGETPPDTWEDFLRVGTKLKEINVPAGIQMGHSRDGNAALLCLMWGYGASVTAEDGKTITINSPQTAKALAMGKKMFESAMNPDVISWDDGANNRAFLAGQASMVFNSPSIYKAAMGKKITIPETGEPLADAIDHILPPKGPEGRFAFADVLSLGIWNFSKNQDLAKEFLKFHFQKAQFDPFLDTAVGYNVPFLKDHRQHKIFTSDKKIRYINQISPFEHTLGYPGPVTAASQMVWDLFIINNMFSYVATGQKSIDEAMQWAEKEIQAVFAGQKTN